MADRNVRLITKRTSVPGKIPTGTTGSETNFIAQGELASNLVDKKLFSYDGSNIFEFGVNSFLGLTGGTISGNIILNSISANTYLGLPDDISITSFTYNSANTFTLTNNTGGTLSAIINVMTGLTVNGGLSATAYTGDTITLNTSGSGTVGLLLNTVSNQDSKLHFSTNNAASARGRLYVEDASQTFNLYTLNSDTIFWNGNGLAQSKTLTLYTDTTAKFENKLTVGSLNIQNTPSGVSIYNLAIDSSGNVISAITNSIDVYVTGGTYSAGTAIFTNNTGGTFNVTGFSTGSTVTLQQAYNASSNPEITTNSTIGGVTISDGVGSGTTVFNINSTGSTNLFNVVGDGTSVFGSNISIDGKDVSYYPITIRSARNDLTRMQILNGGATQTDLQIATNNGANAIYYGVSSTNNAFIDNRTTGNLLFQNGGVTQMVFNTIGDFGIGENTPTAKLHIKSTGNTSSGYALKVDDSTSNPLLYIRNDGSTLVNGSLTSNSISATTISGGTLYSGSTNLYDIFATSVGASDVTRVQPGSNISTGGTGNFPVINLVDSPSVNNITFSGTTIGGTIQAGDGTFTTLSGTNISATTFYGSGANLTGISGSFGITVDGSGSVITTGNKGYAVMPYNAMITGWDIISNTSGTCVVDIWKNTSIPTSANTITGSEMPTLLNQQINSNNTINSWNKNISINDIISFNVLTASTVSRINLIIKVIKI